ncbi:MAG: peptidase M48, Ste24p [Alphaproteobacteria bacterium]|nr:MAG: peptidase M48, Ste24p [Alphaproteobacteria bacterium]
MRKLLVGLIGALAAGSIPHGAARGQAATEQSLVAMRALDQRVATIGHRLAVANLDLCRQRMNLPGFAVHDLSQYGPDFRAAAIAAFGLDAGPGVLALVPDSPAEQGGLRLDDVLLGIDGRSLAGAGPARSRTFDRMAEILDILEAAFADGSADMQVRRAGASLSLHIGSAAGCATRFQLIPSRRLNAQADGRYVQITTAIADYVADDDELAAVIAHEFAHNVLGHRVRLDRAHVSRGFFANFGSNATRIRETEAEADRFSVYLLDRAGYDPEAAVRFWERFGRRGLNFLGSPTHPNWQRRISMIQAEIAAIRAARAQGRIPVPPLSAPAE